MPTFELLDSGSKSFASLVTRLPALVAIAPSETDIEPLPCSVEMLLDLDARGRLRVRHCLVLGDEVTTELIRRIPVGLWAKAAVTTLRLVEDVDGPLPSVVSVKDLDGVARVCRWAWATGHTPLGILDRNYGVTKTTASRWISTARRRSLL